MSKEEIVLAGGCFWGVEELLRQVPGVLETEVGYCGGKTEKPQYRDVKLGETGHAESVRIVFENEKIGLEKLLEEHFFKLHDPTTKNRQGNDLGSQYRSVVFYNSSEQKKTAEEVIEKVGASGFWKAPLVTELVPLERFWSAEEEHQDYLQKHPGGYTCHFYRS